MKRKAFSLFLLFIMLISAASTAYATDQISVILQRMERVEGLYLDAPVYVKVGEAFIAKAVFQPKESAPDDLFWYTGDKSILSYPGASGENGEQDGLRGEDAFSFTYLARKTGVATIAVYTPDEHVFCLRDIKVVDADIDEYYELLSASSYSRLLDDPAVYNAVQNILLNWDRISRFDTNTIMSRARNAPETYSNLFVWSLLDYIRAKGEKNNWSENANTIFIRSAEIVEAFFHEAGHAIDCSYTFHKKSFSIYSGFERYLFGELKTAVMKIIMTQVQKVADESGKNVPDSVVSAIVYEIVSGYNSYDENTGEHFLIYKYANMPVVMKVHEMPYPKLCKEGYEDIWCKSLDNIAIFLNQRQKAAEMKDKIWHESANNVMLGDMVSGFTNNTVETTYGHAGKFQEGKVKNYWYTDPETPTYNQNSEAWAEYFSSVMCGTPGVADNREFFPSACETMDIMATNLLEIYIDKHQ